MKAITNRDVLLELLFMQLTDDQVEQEYKLRQEGITHPWVNRAIGECNQDEVSLIQKTINDLDSGVLFNITRSQLSEKLAEVFDDVRQDAISRFKTKQSMCDT